MEALSAVSPTALVGIAGGGVTGTALRLRVVADIVGQPVTRLHQSHVWAGRRLQPAYHAFAVHRPASRHAAHSGPTSVPGLPGHALLFAGGGQPAVAVVSRQPDVEQPAPRHDYHIRHPPHHGHAAVLPGACRVRHRYPLQPGPAARARADAVLLSSPHQLLQYLQQPGSAGKGLDTQHRAERAAVGLRYPAPTTSVVFWACFRPRKRLRYNGAHFISSRPWCQHASSWGDGSTTTTTAILR